MNQARKKVLYLITKATWGGGQRYVYDLVDISPKHDFEAVVAYGTPGKLANDLKDTGIKLKELPSLGRDVALVSDIKSFLETWRCIREVRPDVVHLNSSKAAALGALAARLAGVRNIIFTVHGWPFNEKRGVLSRLLIYKISWFTALLSHKVIVVSKSDETQGKKMWLVGKKIRYVPIGITAPDFLSREGTAAALSLPLSDLPRVVTIAELTRNKGLRYAIEAIAELNKRSVGVEYYIIGEGEERSRLGALAEVCGVAKRIHFLGFIRNASTYLRAFEVFLLPSVKEGMPYVLLEAAAAGLPIITTTVVNPEFVERANRVRAIPPGDPDAIATAIQDALRESAEQELFSTEEYPLLSEMVGQTIALYR